MDTAQHIREYINHIPDTAYVREVFAAKSIRAVCNVLLELLQSGDPDDVHLAQVFIRDVVNYRIVPAFVTYLPHSGIFDALRANLYAPNATIRSLSLFFIERMAPRAYAARAFSGAFPIYLQRDPLLLYELLSSFLYVAESKHLWKYLHIIASNPNYLIRWSLMGDGQSPLPDVTVHEDKYLRRNLLRLLSRLTSDPHPLIRAEAAYRLHKLPTRKQERQWRLGNRRAFQQNRRARRQASLQNEPALTFFGVYIRFRNYLSVTEQPDYDMKTLDAFVCYLQAHPPSPHSDDEPFDALAFARAFDAWVASGN